MDYGLLYNAFKPEGITKMSPAYLLTLFTDPLVQCPSTVFCEHEAIITLNLL